MRNEDSSVWVISYMIVSSAAVARAHSDSGITITMKWYEKPSEQSTASLAQLISKSPRRNIRRDGRV